MIQEKKFRELQQFCNDHEVILVAVSKTKPVEDIKSLYDLGQRVFGENKVQELVDKAAQLPEDTEWHLIGHLQTNKVKQVLPHVHLIHSIDSIRLLNEIEKEAGKLNKKVSVLLQLKIASEDTKYGLSREEADKLVQDYIDGAFPHIIISGLMGMASFSENMEIVRKEFRQLKDYYLLLKLGVLSIHKSFNILSMGMSGDFKLAVEEGSNMIRVGSLLFGER